MSQIAPDMLADNIACRCCGYNLRGLDETGRCPECGTPVGLSIKGDLLRFADPVWLRKLNIGLQLMFWGAICFIIFQPVSFVFQWYSPRVGLPMSYFAIGLISVAGVWLATEPDPTGLAEAQYLTSRKLIRITLIIGLAHRIFGMGATALVFSPEVRLAMTIVAAIAGIIGVVGEVAKFKYLRQIAGRIPSDSLAWWSMFLMWGYAFVHGFLVLSSAFSQILISASGRIGSWYRVYGLTILLILLAYWVMVIFAAILYGRFARAVREQRIASLATWAAMTSSKGEVSA